MVEGARESQEGDVFLVSLLAIDSVVSGRCTLHDPTSTDVFRR